MEGRGFFRTTVRRPGADSGEAAKTLGLLYKLNLEAALAETRDEFFFRILNRTVSLVHYHRSAFIDLRGKTSKLLGVSGLERIDARSELSELYLKAAGRIVQPEEARVLDRDGFMECGKQAWDNLADIAPGLSVFWLPLFIRKRLAGGLWLERWEHRPWRQTEIKLLASLVQGYGASWEKFETGTPLLERARMILTGKRLIPVLLILCLLAFILRVPLRVVAPCEVIPEEPFVVSAPLNGVVDAVVVEPGQNVKPGDLLFMYDKRVPLEELEVARQQVNIIGATLKRSRMQAFNSLSAKEDIALLIMQFEQEKIRLGLAEYNASKLEVRAETSGQVVIDDPDAWRGRPVAVGEKALMIIDPAKTKLRIWFPEDDNLDFDPKRPLKAFLNAFPESELEAELEYVAPNVTASPKGAPCVKGEAKWLKTVPGIKLGMQGSAVAYGQKTPLAFWLLRKPFIWLRNFAGF